MHHHLDLRMARHGALLLLLGMLTGFFITKFPTRAVGDAAHMTGLVGGYGLIAISALWPKLKLGRFWSVAGAWITSLSLYLNWLGIILLFGSGPGAEKLPELVRQLVPIGHDILQAAIATSLVSVIFILIGLCNLSKSIASAPAAQPGPA